MALRLIILLEDRAAHTEPDHPAIVSDRLGRRRDGHRFEPRLEDLQTFLAERLRHQRDQPIELTIIIGAYGIEHTIGKLGRIMLRLHGCRPEAFARLFHDAADHAVAVVTPFVDRWRQFQHAPRQELFLYMYVRKEAVLSSQIEGTQSTLSDLLRLETEAQASQPIDDISEVSNYVDAMMHGLERLEEMPLSLRLIREMHERLLQSGRGRHEEPR